jgi:Ca-activated chloride channel family protein
LLVLLPLVALFIGLLYWKRWARLKFGDKRLVDQLLKHYSPKLFNSKIILVLAAITLCILAAANLRRPVQSKAGDGTGVDVMIALDVSKSMLSQDVTPSRLDKAKQFIINLLPKLQENRVGLVLFAGEAYLQMPLTPDIAAMKMFLANANPGAVPVQGTVLSEALEVSSNSLDVKQKKYKAVILITDGEDNDESAIEAAEGLFENGVVVHALGIGSPEGSNIIEPGDTEPKKDMDGNIVVSKLNEELLRKIAFVTKGGYQRLDNTSDATTALAAQLNGMEKKKFAVAGKIGYTNFFPFFIGFALLFLIAEHFIPERKRRVA